MNCPPAAAAPHNPLTNYARAAAGAHYCTQQTDTTWHWQAAVRIDKKAHIWDATLTNSRRTCLAASENRQELSDIAFEGFNLG